MMRPRLPGFGSALVAPLLLVTSACGGAAQLKVGGNAEAAPPATPSMVPGAPAATRGEMGVMADAAPAPPPAPAAPPADQAAPPGTDQALVASREMLDIEARLLLQVQNVRRAVKALRDLSTQRGGVVIEERVDSSARYGSAELTLRVPSRSAEVVFRDLETVGTVLNQSVTARDIGKEFFDANLRLSSLTATLERYEQILTQASKVEEILRIEQELSRVRAEIEQVKGNLRFLSDRAARATVYVSLRERAPAVVEVDEPEARFFPGVRGGVVLDFGRQQDSAHFGGGLSVRFARYFSLDLDLAKRRHSDERGPDALIATVGGETYSELLGDGKRRILNPYLGVRAGFGRFGEDDQAVVGAAVGLELFRTRWLHIDLDTRHYLAFGGERGGHYVLVPALGANVAF